MIRTFGYLLLGILLGCSTLKQPERVFVAPDLPAFWTDSIKKSRITSSVLADTLPTYKNFFKDSLLCKLLSTAMAQNFDIQTALAQIRAAEANFIQAQGRRLPFVSFDFGMGLEKYGEFTQEAVGNYDVGFSENIPKERRVPYPILPNFNLGLTTRWEVDIWHKLRDNIRARSLDVLTEREGLNFLKMLITSQIAMHYYELISMDYAFWVLEKNIDFQQKAIEIVRVQKQSGFLNSLAVQQLQAQLFTLRTTQKQISQNIIHLENGINNLLGRRYQKVVRSLASFSQDSLLLDLSEAELSTRILLARRDIVKAELALASAEIDISVARKAFFPNLNLNAFLGLTSFSLAQWFNWPSIAANLLGSLAYPLFNKTRLRAQLKQKQIRAKQSLYQYHKVVINGYNEVQKNLQLLRTLKDNYILQQKRLALLEEAKQTATELAMSSYANYLEIITAQRSYLDALLESIKVRQQIFSTQIDLYKSLGGGWH